jgi:hypothetical protein
MRTPRAGWSQVWWPEVEVDRCRCAAPCIVTVSHQITTRSVRLKEMRTCGLALRKRWRGAIRGHEGGADTTRWPLALWRCEETVASAWPTGQQAAAFVKQCLLGQPQAAGGRCMRA